jgi:hypothetical protein
MSTENPKARGAARIAPLVTTAILLAGCFSSAPVAPPTPGCHLSYPNGTPVDCAQDAVDGTSATAMPGLCSVQREGDGWWFQLRPNQALGEMTLLSHIGIGAYLIAGFSQEGEGFAVRHVQGAMETRFPIDQSQPLRFQILIATDSYDFELGGMPQLITPRWSVYQDELWVIYFAPLADRAFQNVTWIQLPEGREFPISTLSFSQNGSDYRLRVVRDAHHMETGTQRNDLAPLFLARPCLVPG